MKTVDKTVDNRTFKTIEELRGTIIRRQMDDRREVIFVGPKAMAAIVSKMPNDVVVSKGIWENWTQVAAIRIDGELRSFKRAADGEKMFFYELDS